MAINPGCNSKISYTGDGVQQEFTYPFTTIEDEAWISVSSVTLNKVNIGKKAFVGAASLVSKSVKNGHKVFGLPARVIGKNSE